MAVEAGAVATAAAGDAEVVAGQGAAAVETAVAVITSAVIVTFMRWPIKLERDSSKLTPHKIFRLRLPMSPKNCAGSTASAFIPSGRPRPDSDVRLVCG